MIWLFIGGILLLAFWGYVALGPDVPEEEPPAKDTRLYGGAPYKPTSDHTYHDPSSGMIW